MCCRAMWRCARNSLAKFTSTFLWCRPRWIRWRNRVWRLRWRKRAASASSIKICRRTHRRRKSPRWSVLKAAWWKIPSPLALRWRCVMCWVWRVNIKFRACPWCKVSSWSALLPTAICALKIIWISRFKTSWPRASVWLLLKKILV